MLRGVAGCDVSKFSRSRAQQLSLILVRRVATVAPCCGMLQCGMILVCPCSTAPVETVCTTSSVTHWSFLLYDLFLFRWLRRCTHIPNKTDLALNKTNSFFSGELPHVFGISETDRNQQA